MQDGTTDRCTTGSTALLEDPTHSKIASGPAPTVTESSTELTALIGKVVRYYDCGWRFGTLLGLGKKGAHIQHPCSGGHWIAVENVGAA